MTAFLLFLLIGLVQFAAVVLLRRKNADVRWVGHLVSGLLAGGLIACLPVRIPAQGFDFPPWGFPIVGLLSGLLTGSADRGRIFERELLQFFITPALSLLLAFLLASGVLLALRWSGREDAIRPYIFPVCLTCLLIGFMTVFGYTFPRRWFKRYME
jgi:hypothetical protein